LKRSNRLILLVGLFLAVVAFVGIYLLISDSQPTDRGEPDELPTVFATRDIPLGVPVELDMVEVRQLPVTQRDATAFADTSLVVGEIVRKNIPTGAQLVAADFSDRTVELVVPPGRRAFAVQVDQITGVGALIRAGDNVDALVGFTSDKFPVVTVNPNDDSIVPVAGINATTVKMLLQGMQVLGVLLPPPPVDENGQPIDDPTLSGQQEIVILSVSAQQAEVMKFAQMDGNISLVLRAFEDFVDPEDATVRVEPVPDATTGIILRTLVDEYGVLIPQIIETILPTQEAP
jgi:Flp pilus assembly protein CpaB